MNKRKITNPEKFLSLGGALSCLGSISKGMEDALMYEHGNKIANQLTQVELQQAARNKRFRKHQLNLKRK